MTNTIIALYDDFQQAQSAAFALRDSRVPLSDMTIISRKDSEEMYNRYVNELDVREPQFISETTSESTRAFIAALIGALLGGVLTMLPTIGQTHWINPYYTALLAFGIGAITGGIATLVLSLMIDAGRNIGQLSRLYRQSLYEGMSVLVVNDRKNRADKIKDVMHERAPIDITEREDMFPGKAWLADLSERRSDIGEDEDSIHTIADDRYRTFDWRHKHA